jgi:hypothetical protein
MIGLCLTRRVFLASLSATAIGSLAEARTQPLPTLVVTKDPSCGCCTAWVDHMRRGGFKVDVTESPEVDEMKARLEVPKDLISCHTAEVSGYVIEGHVPAEAVKRLLEKRPNARGLAVPGMPRGSPGMEVEHAQLDAYEVVLFGPSGRSTFARYLGDRAI